MDVFIHKIDQTKPIGIFTDNQNRKRVIFRGRKGFPVIAAGIEHRKNGRDYIRWRQLGNCVDCETLCLIKARHRCERCYIKYNNNNKKEEKNNEKNICDGGFPHREQKLQERFVRINIGED